MQISTEQIEKLTRNEIIEHLVRMLEKVAESQSTSPHEVIGQLSEDASKCWKSAFKNYPGHA